MVELRQVSKSYKDKTVLINLSLSVKRGQIFGLTGKNGSGKTSLLKIICGLEKADSGDVRIINHNPGKSSIGVSLYETSQLINELDGYTFLNFIGRIYKIPIFEIDKRILELSSHFEFSDVLYKPIGSYSTGTRKKISISAAIFHKPHLLLLDEPFENLDAIVHQKLVTLVKKYISPEKTIIITSGQTDHFLGLTDNIAVLSDGRIMDLHADGGLQKMRGRSNISPETDK